MKIRVFRHGKRILSLLLVMVMVLTITPIQAKAGTGKYDVGRYVGLYSTSKDALSGYYVVFNVKGELIRSDQMESPALALTCWRALSEEDKRTVTKVFAFAPEERMQQFGYKGSKELTDFANEKGAWTEAWEKWADGIAKKNFGDLDSKLSDANYSTWVKQYKEINTDNYTEDAVKLLKSDNPKAKNIRAEYDFMCAYLDTARECYKAVAKAKVLQTQVAVKGISKELINLIMSNAVCPMLTPGSGITGAATLLGKYQSVANDVTGMVWDRLMSLKDAYVAMYDASRGQSEISARTLLDMYSNTIDTNLEIINMCMEDADRLKNDINSSADVWLQIIKDEEEETNNRVTKEKDSVDKIVVISDYLREHYSDRLSKDHMSVVYNGIDADRFICYRGEKREARGTIRFLNVASMIANKGQEVILKAVKILQNEGISDFMVSLVGGGSKEKDLIRYANDLGIIDKVLFCGQTDKVEEYYQNSDVFIMSSKAEAFGRVTVEAMMEGCCVIGSDSGATPELIEDGVTGLLYKCENVEDLARIMKGIILGDIDYKAIATQGQDYAIKNYSAAKNADGIYSIYQEIYDMTK